MATSLTTLRSLTLKKADLQTNTISQAELDSFINLSAAELQDIMMQADQDRFIRDFAFTVSSGDGYSLPTGILAVMAVDKLIGTEYVSLTKWNMSERNSYDVNVYDPQLVRYRLVGNEILFRPETEATGSYRLWYIPVYSDLSNTSDELPAELDIWKEYVIITAAIKCLVKLERDVSALLLLQGKMEQRIRNSAAQRDKAEPETIVDTSTLDWSTEIFWR